MSGRPNYLKAAFANIYNLSLLGGALVAAWATGDYALGAIALGAEALWLLFGPDLKGFQRAVDRAEREEEQKAEQQRLDKLMQSLPQHDWARAQALNNLRKEIERDMQQNPSFKAILLQTELDKLSHLYRSFVQLASSCARAESYLSASNPRELQKQMDSMKSVQEKATDAQVAELARRNLQVLERRQQTLVDIQNFLNRARGQMLLIENSVRLLRDQVLTMGSPEQLGEQLDDLITGVDALQATVREQESLFNPPVGMEPISPVAAPEQGEPRRAEGTREKS